MGSGNAGGMIGGGIGESVGGIVGGIRGLWRGRKSDKAYEDYLRRARGQLAMDPEKALAFLKLSDRSAMEDMDPTSKGYGLEATRRLLERGAGTGLDTQGKVALAEANQRAGGQARAARQAIIQEYANRGQVGSGAQMAGDLAGSQAAYEAAAASGGQAAAAAEERRLNANYMAGQQAQGQQGLEQARAQAIDALRKFNVGARQNVVAGQSNAIQGYGQGVQGYGTYQQNQTDKDTKNIQGVGSGTGSIIGSLYGMA
jgi:hypothetical protein